MVESTKKRLPNIIMDMPYCAAAGYGIGVKGYLDFGPSPFIKDEFPMIEQPETKNIKSVSQFVQSIEEQSEALSVTASVSFSGWGAEA